MLQSPKYWWECCFKKVIAKKCNEMKNKKKYK